MHKDILTHKQYVLEQLRNDLSDEKRAALYTYHTDRVRDFQHERLIHLLVTFFFGFLLLVTIAGLQSTRLVELQLPLLALAIILFGLELAYIRYYYHLENGVQSLYTLTDQFRNTK